MFAKRLVARTLLVAGLAVVALGLSANPASAEEACTTVWHDWVGSYTVCYPLP